MVEQPPPSRASQAPVRDPVAALVARCIDRMEDEGPAVLDELCRVHPEHALKLRAHIARLQKVGLVGEMPAAADIPERLGAFRIVSLLGRGGMGVVYLAEQDDLQRRVALKLVRPEHLFFPGARQRFRREIEAAARLQHPGIIPVFSAGEEHGVPFYAMEYVRGAALEEVLAALAGRNVARLTGADMRRAVEQVVDGREGPAARAAGAAHVSAAIGSGTSRGSGAATAGAARGSGAAAAGAARGSSAGTVGAALFAGTWTEAALRIARQVALALQHAHEQGVLHRDVKPSNIMVTPEGRVLLLDFGLATAEGSTRLTRSGSQVGSLAWMSPEQVRGTTDGLDERTDVYSLGATLHELLALRSPFAAATVDETRQRILEGRPASLRELNPAVPRDAETVCLKAMDAARERRYASAGDLADDLGNALELRPVQARRPGAWLKARRWSQRNPAIAVAAVLGALLLVGGPAGYGFVQGRAAERERDLNTQLAASNAQLDGALAEVQDGNAKLQRSLEEERRQRESAQRSFDRSLEAVDSLLADVGSQDLRDVPQFERVRGRLLERALDFYRALEAERPADADVRKEQARTLRSIGDLLAELGRDDEARAAYEKALPALRTLMAESGDDPDLHFTYAGTLSQLAMRDYLDGHGDVAQQRWTEARDELQPLADRPRPQPEWVFNLATVISNLALVAHDAGDEQTAMRLHEESARLLGPVCLAHPDVTEYAAMRAHQLSDAATIATQSGLADAAEPLLRDAWHVLKELTAREPWNRRLRVSAVEAASNFGLLMLTRTDRAEAESVLRDGWALGAALAHDYPSDETAGRHAGLIGINLVAELINQERAAEAEPIAVQACALLESLVARFPADPQHASSLGFGAAAASAVHLKLGQLDLAATEAARAVQILRESRAALPANAFVGASLAVSLCQQADVERAQGDPAAALADLEEALTLAQGRPDILYQAAETLGACHETALAANPRDDALVDELRQRTLDVLGQAIDAGCNDAARMGSTPAFAALHALPAFEDLLARAGG